MAPAAADARNEDALAAEGRGETAPRRKGITRSGLAWAALESGRYPYNTLIASIVFLPFFASTIVGDPVEGQALVGELAKIAGIIAALTAPLLGASLDRFGPRKPWIASGTLLMALLLASLWWAKPGPGGLSIPAIIGILVAVKVLYAYTEVIHNSLLVRAADGGSVSRLSATSFGLGYGASIVGLVGFLWAFVLPVQYDLWWTPANPLFGLDPARYEHIRIVGPVVATTLGLMMLPLLFFTRDYPRGNVSVLAGLAAGWAHFRSLPKHLKRSPNASLFVFSRMLYADGTAATTMFMGIYAAGVMKWGATELLLFGIVKLALALTGAFASVGLEERFGSKRAVQIGLVGAIVVLTGVLGTGPDHVFFMKGDESLLVPVVDLPLFNTLPELVFLAFATITSMFVTVIASASRSLLTKITPAEETGAFFGLYALASSATAWLAPMMIEFFTRQTGTQQGGFAPIVLFFMLGFVGLWFVTYSREANG